MHFKARDLWSALDGPLLSLSAGAAVPLILLTLVTLPGCGKFGDRQDPDFLLRYKPPGIGCLNGLGPVLEKYTKGQLSSEEWAAACDCVTGGVAQFELRILPASEAGYDRADVSAFLAKFLLTEYPENAGLVGSLFVLKAAVIGGTTEVITIPELHEFSRLVGVIKRETLALLPFLKARNQRQDAETLLHYADALASAGTTFAAALHVSANRDFSWDEAQSLANELGKVVHWPVPGELISWARTGKNLIFGGWDGGVEAAQLPVVLKLASEYTGIAAAAAAFDPTRAGTPNAAADFYIRLAHRFRPTLDESLTRHGGAIPLDAFDKVIDVLPTEWISIDRMIVKRTLRPAINRLLRSQVPDAADRGVFDLLYTAADRWNESQILLEQVFRFLNASGSGSPGVTPDAFVQMALAYADQLDSHGKDLIARLVLLAGKFRPLSVGEDSQVTFAPLDHLSMMGLGRLLWIRIGAEEMLTSYAGQPDKGLVVQELKKLIHDYQDLGFAYHEIDNTIPDAYAKRFREADLFTYASDGDGFLGLDEGTYYLSYFFSGNALSKKVRARMEPVCGQNGRDQLNWVWMDADCARREFFSHFSEFADHFPDLVAYWNGMDDAGRARFSQAIEKGSRLYGFSSKPWASYDTTSIVGLLHFMETLFQRFDTDGDQALGLHETLTTYPLFRRSLAEISGQNPNDDGMLQAILTYVVYYGEPPKQNFLGIAKFLLWRADKPFWNVHADRQAIYSVMAGFSGTSTVPNDPPH